LTAKQKKPSNPAIDKRSCGGHRRREAIQKATDMAVAMVKRALSRGLKKVCEMKPWEIEINVVFQ
jgi:hypothetical protein